jgi:hypothetical protein
MDILARCPLTAWSRRSEGSGPNAVLRVWIGICDGAAGTHGSGLSPIPLPRLRQAACSASLLNRAQYPSDVIVLMVLRRLRYKLSLRDVAEMFLVRGIVFSHQAVRTGRRNSRWRQNFAIVDSVASVEAGRWARRVPAHHAIFT